MDDLLREFLAETTESLAVLDVELVRLERGDLATLSNIFRLMHTIKGTCGFLGLPRLGAVAHAGENILGKFRDGELDVTPAAVTLILKAIDRIRVLLAELEAGGAEPQGSDEELIAEINGMAGGNLAVEAEPSLSAPALPAFNDEGFPVAAELLVEVAHAMGEPVETAAVPAVAAPPAPPKPAVSEKQPETRESATAASSIRVNVDVIENLMTLISELVLTRNQLLQTQRVQKDNEFKWDPLESTCRHASLSIL